MSAEILIQQLLNAVSLGSIYALLALGLAVVYSVLNLLNFAYGELVTIVGYTMFLLLGAGVGFWTAGLAGIVMAIAFSLLTELVAFRPLRGAPAYAVIFASFAVSVIVQSLIRNIISPRAQGILVPGWMDAVLQLGELRVPLLSLITIGVAALAMVLLTWVLQRTRYGLAIQAAAEDFRITRLMGARAGQMISLAFIVSGALAGVAGFLWVARTGGLEPGMGFNPLLQSFIAVVLGGIGSLRGAVVGGYALAFIQVGLQVFLPSEIVPFTAALSLLAVVAILYFRPQGFTKKIEERVA